MSDWRLQGQEKYLKGVELEFSNYRVRSESLFFYYKNKECKKE